MSYQPFLPTSAVYNSVPPVAVDGQPIDVQADINGNTLVSLATQIAGENLTDNVMMTANKPVSGAAYSPSIYAPLTQVTKNFIKATPGNVFSFDITNDNAAVRYFQLHNKITAPAGTDVPIYSWKVPAGTANNPGFLTLGSEFFTGSGRYFSVGIGWAISTTLATFTDAATNTEHVVHVHFL